MYTEKRGTYTIPTELEESTWRIKIRYINLELYHVNTNSPQLAKKGVVVTDSPVPVAKIDTTCKSNISILKKKIPKMLVLT
jgi:hypothetical protein